MKNVYKFGAAVLMVVALKSFYTHTRVALAAAPIGTDVWVIASYVRNSIFIPLLEESLRTFDVFLHFPYVTVCIIGKELIEWSHPCDSIGFVVWLVLNKSIVHLGLYVTQCRIGFTNAVLLHIMLNTSVDLIQYCADIGMVYAVLSLFIGPIIVMAYMLWFILKYDNSVL